MAFFELTHIRYNGMSNRLLCPISFASKMRYWSPVIWKVECIKVENFKIWLLWCFYFLPVNYYSISKQEGFKLGFNPKWFIKPRWIQIVLKQVWVRFGSLKVKIWGQLVSGWLGWLGFTYQSPYFISSISFPNEPLISWTFLDHFCQQFWVGLLLQPRKSDDNNAQEKYNWSVVHLEKKYYL